MLDSNLAAFIVFGALFVICMIGLFIANAASERLINTRRVDGADQMRAGSGRLATSPR